jgi:hypothetical protein
MASERISGRVVSVLNDRELAINRGSNDGVVIGTRFAVLIEGPELKDPDTGESLGTVELPKAIVKVVRVQPRVSIARTFHTKVISYGFSAFTSERRKVDTLSVEETIESEIDEGSWIVKAGDKVLETVGDEYLSPND